MKPGATLGLSHGFLLGVMKNDNVDFRKDINVVLVAPKVRPGGMRACVCVGGVEVGGRGESGKTGARQHCWVRVSMFMHVI